MLYSSVSPSSFESINNRWYPEVLQHCPNVPIVLAASKIDIRTDEETVERLAANRQAPITYEQGLALSKEINAAEFIERSALTRQGLTQVFDECMRCVADPGSKAQKQKQKSGCTLL